jgi:hypothetical protein
MVGDWMGSIYDVGGRRHDVRMFLDRDGRYEWTECSEPDQQLSQVGHWTLHENETVIELRRDDAGSAPVRTRRWAVLSVTSCEESNVLLVLREVILASRNLPILFYRVHCDGRGYGTDWQSRLGNANLT